MLETKSLQKLLATERNNKTEED